jgi:hypothetical protein
LSHAPDLFCFSYFSNRISAFPLGTLRPQSSSYLYLLSSWNYRHAPQYWARIWILKGLCFVHCSVPGSSQQCLVQLHGIKDMLSQIVFHAQGWSH